MTTKNSGQRNSLVVRRVHGGRADDRGRGEVDRNERQEHGLRREASDRAAVLGPRCPGGHEALVV